MKLVKIKEIVLKRDVTSLSIDNVFSADYDDYLLVCSYGMGTSPSNQIRLIDASGNEDSGSEYQIHQIRVNSSGQLFQRADGNYIFDFFWKYTGNNHLGFIFRPFDSTLPTAMQVWGSQSSGNSYTDAGLNHDRQQSNRGIKFTQYSGSVYYNQGTITVYGIAD